MRSSQGYPRPLLEQLRVDQRNSAVAPIRHDKCQAIRTQRDLGWASAGQDVADVRPLGVEHAHAVGQMQGDVQPASIGGPGQVQWLVRGRSRFARFNIYGEPTDLLEIGRREQNDFVPEAAGDGDQTRHRILDRVMRTRTRTAPGDDLEIVEPDCQDFSIFAGPGAIVVSNEPVLPGRVYLDPGRAGGGETTAPDSTIGRALELRQGRLAVGQGGIPVAAVRGDRQTVWLVAFGWSWIEGDASQEIPGCRIEAQDFVGHGDSHVYRCSPGLFALTRLFTTAAGCSEYADGQGGRATNQNCGASFHRPVFMSDT